MAVKIYETKDNTLDNVSNTYESADKRDILIANNVIRINMKDTSNNSPITGLNIGSSVTTIDNESFKDCTSLGSVTGGTNLVNIEDCCFKGCKSLAVVDLLQQKNSIKMIGASAFYDCGFESLTLNISEQYGSQEKSIDDHVFANCKKLKTLNIQCDQVYDYMFSNCLCLDNVTFADNLKLISERAFEDCTSLTSVTINGNLNTIRDGAFYGCTGIMEFSFGQTSKLDGIGCIGDDILNGSKISAITFPTSLTSLGSISDNALKNIVSLKTIRFDGITSADLFPDTSMSVEFDIEPNIWLVAKKDNAVGKLKYQKILPYDAICYAVEYAISNHIPIVLFYGCEGCHFSSALEKHINTGEFISWMKGLADNQGKYYMFISVYGDGKAYTYIRKRLYKNPALFNYTFPDIKQISRCGKVNVMYIGPDTSAELKTYKWSLLSYSTGQVKINKREQKSPPDIPDDKYPGTPEWIEDSPKISGDFRLNYTYQKIFDVLKNKMLGGDLQSVGNRSFGKKTIEVGNRISETKCFGLNHVVTLYSSEGVSAIYDPSKQSV